VENKLIKWDTMRTAVAECHSVDEITLIRNKAEAYRYALRQAKESPEVIRKAEEIKLRAERRAGELLKETIRKPEEGRPVEVSKGTTLIDMGISRDQSSKWQKIASIPEEKFENFLSVQKELSTSGIIKEIRKEERKAAVEKQIKEIEEGEIKTPTGNFDVIVIDPPWDYSEKGGFNYKQHDIEGNRGGVDYSTMSMYEIQNIGLPTKKDCVVFLWTTHAFIRDAFTLLDNWDFQYKATLVWDKMKMGIGRTIRLQCEFCLIGTKGKPVISGSSERDIITESRRQHSRKPDAFYEMVDRMCYGRKLDYFSRENRNGWSSYGAESNKF
jgi:N6-adenosine-specific RNA methylase IME4